MIYLDWAATAKPNKTLILEAIEESFVYFANPSSHHKDGKNAKERLEEARSSIASLIGADASEIYFCSSATEATQIFFSSLLNQHFKNEIVISDNAHSATREMAKAMQNVGYKVIVVPTEKKGFISHAKLLKSINEKTALLSILLVDNETGAIESVSQIQEAIKNLKLQFASPLFHLDAVQALGKIPIDMSKLYVDCAVFSGHKIGAMRGVGILYLKKSIPVFLRGGGQERGIRAGTENLVAILSLEKCLRHCISSMEERQKKAQSLTNFLIQELAKIDGVEVFPCDRVADIQQKTEEKAGKTFSPFIISFYNHYLKGEVLVRMLSDAGIAISSGSACSANSKEKRGINGVPSQYRENIARVSIGESSEKRDVEVFIQELKKIIGEITWK